MIKPPKNDNEVIIWRRLVSDAFNKPIELSGYATTDLPDMPSGRFFIAYDTTLGNVVVWNGSAWGTV